MFIPKMLLKFTIVYLLNNNFQYSFADDIFSNEDFYPTTLPCDHRFNSMEKIDIVCSQSDQIGESVDAIIKAR